MLERRIPPTTSAAGSLAAVELTTRAANSEAFSSPEAASFDDEAIDSIDVEAFISSDEVLFVILFNWPKATGLQSCSADSAIRIRDLLNDGWMGKGKSFLLCLRDRLKKAIEKDWNS